MGSQKTTSTLDGLPKQFVSSLRTLFDILDENRTGYVELADIQGRWNEERMEGLPNGVVEALKKVTPPSGQLSFERFVAGLKISLLRSKSTNTNGAEETGDKNTEMGTRPSWQGQKSQFNPPSKFSNRPSSSHLQNNERTTATVRPNVIQSRTMSMPHLAPDGAVRGQGHEVKESNGPWSNGQYHRSDEPTQRRPEKLPPQKFEPYISIQKGQDHQNGNKNGFSNNLKNGQQLVRAIPASSNHERVISDTNNLLDFKRENPRSMEEPLTNKKASTKRREPRRHTLNNGIDYNMLKRMKQLEQEKDILLQGLEAVERSRDWYHKQISTIQDKQKDIGKTTSRSDYSVEAHQERMNFQMARIFEVNQQLKALVESSEKGFPLHMNLAVPHRGPLASRTQAQINSARPAPTSTSDLTVKKISMLKDQNKLLTNEVTDKSDRITQLERDKASLIKQLFQTRSTNTKQNYDDATFM